MLNLSQRLILGCALIAALGITLVVATRTALAASGQLHFAIAILISLILVEIATVMLVLHPIRVLANDAKKISGGNLEHRVEWGSRDNFGIIAAELNRIAVRLRDLRDTEAGRRQMEYQLSAAVHQSIFEPIIVTDAKGHILKLNQAATLGGMGKKDEARRMLTELKDSKTETLFTRTSAGQLLKVIDR